MKESLRTLKLIEEEKQKQQDIIDNTAYFCGFALKIETTESKEEIYCVCCHNIHADPSGSFDYRLDTLAKAIENADAQPAKTPKDSKSLHLMERFMCGQGQMITLSKDSVDRSLELLKNYEDGDAESTENT